MDTNQIVFLFRGVERLTIVFGAIVCVVMGIRLYGGKVTFGGKSDLEAEGVGLKIKLSNATPGAILALFGMIVMGVALRTPAQASDAPAPPKASGSTQEAAKQETEKQVATTPPGEGGARGAGGNAGGPAEGPQTGVTKQETRQGSTTTYGSADKAAKILIGELAGADLTNARTQMAYFRQQARSLPGKPSAAYRPVIDGLTGIPDSASDEVIATRMADLKTTANTLR